MKILSIGVFSSFLNEQLQKRTSKYVGIKKIT